MSVIYVDPLNGTDNGDSGRGEDEGTDAYASLTYALANYGSFATTSGNTIYLADTAANVLTASLDCDTSVAKGEAPLVIAGYHYDGSNGGTAGAITRTMPFGQGTTPAGEIDGNSAVTYLTDVNTANTTFYNLKLHGATSNLLWLYYSNCIACELYDGGNTWLTYGGTYESCYIHGDSDSGVIIQAPGRVMNCEVSGGDKGIYSAATYMVVTGNLVYDNDVFGIYCGDYSQVSNNTIDGTGGGGNARGIHGWSTVEHMRIYNNLVTNFAASGQSAIYSPTGGPAVLIGNNAFYNNDVDEDFPTPAIALSNITETSDPYTDRAGGDYSLVSGALSNDAAIMTPGGVSANIGYWQEKPTAGGGTPGKHFSANFS